MGGFLEGLTSAMSPAIAAENAGKRADRRATDREYLQAQTQSIFDDVGLLQQRRSKLDPQSPTYQKDISEIDANLHAARQALQDLYHPQKNPGALQHLAGFIQQHIGQSRGAPQAPPASPADARQRFDIAGLDAVAAGTGQAAPNPILDKRKQLQQAGFTPEQITKIEAVEVGLEAKPTAPRKQTDYATGLRRFVEAEGGDPDNPTAAEEEAFRNQRLKDAAAARATETSRTSTTTDPFGVTSTTNSTMRRGPAGTTQPGATKPGGRMEPVKPAAATSPADAKKKAAAVAPASSGAKQLDAEGHIPSTAKVNPQLREAANQIIDGMDITKSPLPARDKEAAAELARSYGWSGQGLFGPKDKLLIRESTGILKQLGDSSSLSVLDDPVSRQKIGQVLQNPDKRGFIGQSVQNLAAANLTPAEQQFVTLYNQAVGRISGLSQLVRSGRPTEATIERLKTELPSPYTTASSAHARQKLAQIQNEIDIALQKGQFTEGGTTEGGGKGHRIKIGDKTYTYNGTGNTADLSNYTEEK